MKISEMWLREWVNPDLLSEQLAAQLTMAGLAVDAIIPVAGQFNNVIVARVHETKAHPQADKLTLCQVEINANQMVQIVCGAKNVRPGLMVALALPGAKLPGGIKIKESMLRQELSQGMLCSTTELGMDGESEGILELPEDAVVGVDLRDYLKLNDNILDLDLTPNRADCLSIIGIAREVAALNNLTLNLPQIIEETYINHDISHVNVKINAPKACPQYLTRKLQGINKNAQTPIWMKERLRRSGIRAINPIVDILQYVMLEYGQPLHAFDAHKVCEKLHVRFANADEELILLDGKTVVLSEDVLVIADEKQALAMAGVMGGEFSAVNDETTDLILESAFFNPVNISGVARRYGLCTDAAQRFERGVDPYLAKRALLRATELILSIAGGIAGPITHCDDSAHTPQVTPIIFDPLLVQRLSGILLDQNVMRAMLTRLEMIVTDFNATKWSVAVPSHRFDLRLDVDLVEEIVRLFGYDKIPTHVSSISMHAGKMLTKEKTQQQIAKFLVAKGYQEIITYSFVDPELQEALYPGTQVIKLLNPISEELSVMRVGMWSGLLAAMIRNVHRQQQLIKFFEHGVVFEKQDGKIQERASVAGLLSGKIGTLNWNENTHQLDFYDLKGDVQALFALFKCHNVQYLSSQHPALHPGKSAQILRDNQVVGWIGVLHPKLQEALDLSDEVILFEIDLVGFEKTDLVSYKQVSKYPQVRRDLALLVPQEVNANQLEQVICAAVGKKGLKSINIFDIYTGPPVPVAYKSVAIALIFQNLDKTLTDAEINVLIDMILKQLNEQLLVTIRTEHSPE
jgi:phenylalanyl-tRNA synthetase beta chain